LFQIIFSACDIGHPSKDAAIGCFDEILIAQSHEILVVSAAPVFLSLDNPSVNAQAAIPQRHPVHITG
jgi:hypothetical protein